MSPWLGMVLHWFGPLPAWVELFLMRLEANHCARWYLFGDEVEHLGSGPNWRAFPMTLDDLGSLARATINTACATKLDGYGAGDYQPAFGHLFADYLRGYDWWGWADWDVVFGRLDAFFTADHRRDADIISTHPAFVNGTCTILRNTEPVNSLYRHDQLIFCDPATHIYTERYFTERVRQRPDIRFVTLPIEANDRSTPDAKCRLDGDRLMVREVPRAEERECALFHFVRMKEWPL